MKRIHQLLIASLLLFVILSTDVKAQAATLRLSSQLFTLAVNHYQTLHVTGTSSRVIWTSSNKSIAVVSSTGKVTAKAPGTATIYASVAGRKLSGKVTVIKLNTSSAKLVQGATKTLKVYGTTSNVNWYSDNKSVAAVSSTGKVTAKAPGSTSVHAYVSNKILTCKVTVTNVSTTAISVSGTAVIPLDQGVITTQPQDDPSTKIIGYYAAWSRYSGYTPDKIDAKKLTHINYAFANIGSDLKITLGYPDIDQANISQLNQLKLINPGLKTIISVGGWSWSGRFSDAALTEASRATFADSCVAFIVENGFDGIDIDWEYPVSGGLTTNVRRPEDKTNFTLLLETLREKLDAQGKIDGKRYLLTFAGAAGSWYMKNIEPAKISQYVDYANIMTYDLHGTWESYTGFNAPLYSNDPLQPNADQCIRQWINAGFSKDKLIMGVPFYGYIYQSVGNINNGLNQTYSGGASISFAKITSNYLNQPEFTRYFDPIARVPWLYNGSSFITYEDEQSIAEKAGYIKNSGLKGAMIWELSQDPQETLLNTIYQILSN